MIASHPTPFPAYGHRDTGRRGSSHNISNSAVQLPRKLSRPEYEEVSKRAIIAASPEMARGDIPPPEYIQQGLLAQTSQLMSGLSSLAPSHLPSSLPSSHLPAFLTIPLRPPTSSTTPHYPTHALAVSSSNNPEAQALIIPIHALVVASHCARFPEIRAPSSRLQGHNLQLPVIPITLPSPGAFTVLVNYMYSHRLDKVLKELLSPMPSGFMSNLSRRDIRDILDSRSTLHELSKYLCEHDQYSLQQLTARTVRVRDVWYDLVALGLHAPELWDALDLAWEVILGALNIAAAPRA
ncbi:hypothetical protein E1B28_006668 [Marasmius oreades]|uniref:BTB domain-containing protein n=1 Tax=Marasmius oreades TaxID=181124 RepID=A0A9P8AB11_9AGAR|nr:uncharacterized protein E1B28_006668 [Marasmius oreades]KAG7095985.1 hypothetical protein E1B28_006668 [Marasmius oreades]